jgi:hypothetical protein
VPTPAVALPIGASASTDWSPSRPRLQWIDAIWRGRRPLRLAADGYLVKEGLPSAELLVDDPDGEPKELFRRQRLDVD